MRWLHLLLTAVFVLLLTLTAQGQAFNSETHIVRPGETLGLIAQRYGVDMGELAALNQIYNSHLVYTWQELQLPLSQTAASGVNADQSRHIVQRGETLDSIAKRYGIDLFELQSLNGIFNAWIFPGDELALPLPGEPSATQTADIAAPPAINLDRLTHVVRRGDTLGTIAASYGVTLYDLQSANGLWTWIIYPGQELLLPAGATPDSLDADLSETPAIEPVSSDTAGPLTEPGALTHTVRPGETLGIIAVSYGVNLGDLQAVNDLWTWIIYPGQELLLPADATAPDAASTAAQDDDSPADAADADQETAPVSPPNTHVVQRGETLFGIAQQYDVSLDALMAANAISDPHRIHSGLALRVRNLDAYTPPQPAAATPATPAANAARKQYTVQPGDFLSQIGAKFGMSWLAITAVNGISNPDSVHVGTVLQIPTAEEAARYGPVQATNFSNFHNASSHPGARVGVGRELVVMLSTQTAYAYENGILQRRALISSGKAATPTVQGDFKVTRKLPSRHMVGPDYDLPGVPWVLYFYAGYAFHGTYWHNNFGTPMSHGCVNMTTADAKWFYDFAPVGTPVHVRYY